MRLMVRLIVLSLSFNILMSLLAGATVSYGLGARPANPDPNNPRTQSIFVIDAAAGGVKSDQLFIDNRTDKFEAVELYAVDGSISNDGSFSCKQQTDQRSEVGAWIELSLNEVSLPARSHRIVDFSVTLPDSLKAGEHNGCVVIQPRNAEKPRGSMTIQTRQAVRVVVVVPGDIHREVKIDKFAVGAVNGRPRLDFALKNSGNVSADVDVSFRLKDMFGREVYRNNGQQVVIAEQRLSIGYDIDYQPFFGGFYAADLLIAYDKRPGVFGTYDKSELTWASGDSITIFVWPSLWLWLVAGLLVMLLVGPKARRRVAKKASRVKSP